MGFFFITAILTSFTVAMADMPANDGEAVSPFSAKDIKLGEYYLSYDPKDPFSKTYITLDILENVQQEEEIQRKQTQNLPFGEKKMSFTSLKLGPCKWSVFGQRLKDDGDDTPFQSSIQMNSKFGGEPRISIRDEEDDDEERIRFGLRCEEPQIKKFDISVGLVYGIQGLESLSSGEVLNFEQDEDTTIFITFSRKL